MIWSLSRNPRDFNGVFAGIGEVDRGGAAGTAGSGSVLQSDDQGSTWRTIATDLPAVRQLAAGRD
jgi:hypothetical protein